MDRISYWICEIALLGSGYIYVYTIEPRLENKRKILLDTIVFLAFCAIINYFPVSNYFWAELLARLLGFLFLVHLLHVGRRLSWYATVYYSIWAFMSWQLLFELWLICDGAGKSFFEALIVLRWLGEILVYTAGLWVIALTVGKNLPESGQKKIGPRQLGLAALNFLAFQILVLAPGNLEMSRRDRGWLATYLAQILLAVVLYLQNELFKKSEIRQELEMMNLLWKKEQEQYKLSRENIALINQKAHDLKHQIRAIRSASKEDINKYLDEIEDSVQIYEAIVKTGNEVLDTILTEKSLYCKDRGILVSCVADGSQMDFINTVDLYAILGNAIDNAIEAVEKFTHEEMRQIDVMIYRQQQFLAINVVNPSMGNLLYEGGLPVTTKGDQRFRGFGLRSIKHILKRYDGCLSIKEEDGCFSLMMLIPVPSST